MSRSLKRTNADFVKVNETLAEWSATSKSKQKQLSIVVTGKTGVGKSRLVNALLGKHVAPEGRKRSVGCTTEVNSYKMNIMGIKTVVWDSPGLQDGSCDERTYMDNLKETLMDGFDLMIYCIKMDDQRLYGEDKRAIHALTRGFGKNIWSKALVALTFANKISDPDKGDELVYFRSMESEWRQAIDDLLSDLRIDPQIRRTLSVIPAGNNRCLSIPTRENWLSEFWTCCYCVMGDASALYLYEINKDRLKFQGSAEMAAACSIQAPDGRNIPEETVGHGDLADQDLIPREIPLNEEQEERFLKKTKRVLGQLRRRVCSLL